MLSTSLEFRNLIAQNSKVLQKGTLTLADGTVRELAGDDFIMGETSFTDAVSSSGSFDIGAAIINKLECSLNNRDGRFDDYDFTDAEIVAYVGVTLSNGNVEWLCKGTYGVEPPETYGNTIGIEALDNMRLLERPYSDVTTAYPASLSKIVRDICQVCGVILVNSDFANSSFVVNERPDDDSITCIAMMAYVAQVSGNWARCDPLGRLALEWYNTTAFEGEDWLDGDRFDDAAPYASGDSANGGDFLDYGTGDEIEGGSFGPRPWAYLHAISSASVNTDDVVITGVKVTAQDKERENEDDLEGESYLYGSEGYVLEIPDNPLILYGTAASVAALIGPRVVGMRFRPFDVSAIGDPAIQAGDPVVIVDGQMREYRSYITTLTYKVGNFEAFACNAESPGRNKAASYSALTRAIVKIRNSVKREKSAREQATEMLSLLLASASGLYKTEEVQSDGSVIYYLHDKPTLAQSQTVWKVTANAFGVSNDGGQTYSYGVDSNGVAILNRIYAVGIDADYIDTGRIEVRHPITGATIFVADIDTGEVIISASSTMGDRSMGQLLDDVDSSIVSVDVEFAQNQSREQAPAEDSPTWSTDCPAWQAGYYIWQRTATTNANGTTYSDAVCISGRDGATGMNAATIYLYQRSTTQPVTSDIGTLTYTFETAALTGTLGAWSRSIPAGSDTCWVIVATAISNGETDTIAPSEFSEPTSLTSAGVDGLNQATIYLYRRSPSWLAREGDLSAPTAAAMSVSGTTATIPGTVSGETLTLASEAPAKPNVTTSYTFATGVLSPLPMGWYREIPEGTDTIWVTTAVAISSEASDSIAASEWSDVVMLSERGDAISEVVEQYYLSTSETGQVGGSWSEKQPTWKKGRYIWTRSKITWTDGTVTYTEPVLAEMTNSVNEAVAALDEELDSNGTFARLTDNGRVQGIWLKNGALYINASYINTGILTVADHNDPTKIIFRADINTGIVTVGGFNVTEEAIYNDQLKFNGSSLIFRYSGQDIAAIYPQYLVDSSHRMLGQLAIYLPTVLQVFSEYPYQGASSSELLLNYNKVGRSVSVYNIDEIQVSSNILFTGNGMALDGNAHTIGNVRIESSRIRGDGNSKIGDWAVWANALVYGDKTNLASNTIGAKISNRGIGVSFGNQDSYGRYPITELDESGFHIGRCPTGQDTSYKYCANLNETGLFLWTGHPTDSRKVASLWRGDDGRGALRLYDPSDTSNNERSTLSTTGLWFVDASSVERMVLNKSGSLIFKNDSGSLKMELYASGSLKWYDSGAVWGYLSTTRHTGMQDHGIRLAAPNFVALYADDIGVNGYYAPGQSAVYMAGQSGSVRVAVCDTSGNVTGSRTITFTKGLMTTTLS